MKSVHPEGVKRRRRCGEPPAAITPRTINGNISKWALDPHLNTAATGLFCRGGKIKSRLLKFCQRHTTPLSGMEKCDLAKFKRPAATFFLLVKIVWLRQCHYYTYMDRKYPRPGPFRLAADGFWRPPR